MKKLIEDYGIFIAALALMVLAIITISSDPFNSAVFAILAIIVFIIAAVNGDN